MQLQDGVVRLLLVFIILGQSQAFGKFSGNKDFRISQEAFAPGLFFILEGLDERSADQGDQGPQQIDLIERHHFKGQFTDDDQRQDLSLVVDRPCQRRTVV